ncbi:MAG: zeta toxin family protein [Verrucomicrobia bacterium]|nr:zeta toxin family protein [Verrucomicrobiota bacterium]
MPPSDYQRNLDAQYAHDQRLAAQQQRLQESEAQRQQKAAAKAQEEMMKEQQRVANDAKEAAFRAEKRPQYVNAHGDIQPVHTDEEWQQEKQTKQANDAAHDVAAQSGRKFTTSKLTGAPIYLESEQQLEAKRAAAAEALRKKSLNDQIAANKAEFEYQKQSSGAPKLLTDKQKKTLAQEHQAARFGLAGSLDAQTKAVTGGEDWIPWNESPSPEALKARERQKQLSAPDTQLTEDDLKEFEASDSTKPHAAKIRGIQDALAKDEAARQLIRDHATRQADLMLRRDAPDKWQALQRQKIAAMDPEALKAHLEASDADIEKQTAALESAYAPIEQQRALHQQQMEQLQQENEQRRQEGIPAGEIVSYQGPDGQPEHWAKDLAIKRETLIAQAQSAEQEHAPLIEQLRVQHAKLQQDLDLRNEAADAANAKQEEQKQAQTQQKQEALTRLKSNPATAALGQSLEALDNERSYRLADLAAVHDGQPPPEAVAALEQDIQQRGADLLEKAQTREQVAQKVYSALQSVLKSTDEADQKQATDKLTGFTGALTKGVNFFGKAVGNATPLRQPSKLDQSAHYDAAREALKQSLGVSDEEAGTILEDQAKLDWSGAGTLVADKDAFQKFLKTVAGGSPGTAYVENEPTRTLSDGSLTVNPKLLQYPDLYTKAVKDSKASPAAQAAALQQLPDARQELGKQALQLFTSYPGSGFSEWTAQQPKLAKASPVDQALAYADHLRDSSGPVSNLLEQVVTRLWTGTKSVGSQALGLIALSTGNEWSAKTAGAIDQRSGQQKGMLDYTGANDSLFGRAVGMTADIAPSVLVSMGGGFAARGATIAAAGTRPGLMVLQAMSKSLKAAATPADAVKALSSIAGTAGVAGSAFAGGAQTAGSQFAETYGALRQQGYNHEDAVTASRMPAIVAGAMTAMLTLSFGATGVQRVFATPAGKAAAKDRFAVLLQKMGLSQRASAVASGAVKGASEEMPEEIFDELYSQMSAEAVKNPHFNLPAAFGEFVKTLPELAIAVGVMGAGGGGFHAFRDSKTDSSQQQATTPNPANLPETVAAAEQAIDDLHIEGQSPEVLQKTQAAARGVLYVAQGTPLTELDRDTLASLDLVEDPKNPGTFINGRIVPNTKTGVPEVQPYPAGLAPTVNADGTPGQPRPVRVRMENGQPVITQQTLDNLAQLLPAVRAAISNDEKQQQARNASPQPSAAQGTAPNAAQSPVQAPAQPGNQTPSSRPAPGQSGVAPVHIPNIDDLINKGGGVVQVSDGSRKVDFDKFGLTIDGKTAEVAYVELAAHEKGKGLGLAAYEALGHALAARGITLQSSKAQHTQGRALWAKLASKGLATKGSQGVYHFSAKTSVNPAAAARPASKIPPPPSPIITPTTDIDAEIRMREHARNSFDFGADGNAQLDADIATLRDSLTRLNPDAEQRASELATILAERGLTAPQALAAAQHVVSQQGIVGNSAEEQFAQGIDDEMGKVGWVRGSGKNYAFIAPSIDAKPAETTPKPAVEQAPGPAPEGVEPLKNQKPENKTHENPAKSEVKGSALDPEAFIAAAREAKAKTPVKDRMKASRILVLLEKHLFRRAAAFPGGVVFESNGAGAGMSVNPTSDPTKPQLVIDLTTLAYQFSGLLDGQKSSRADNAIRAKLEEELIHGVQVGLYTAKEMADLFNSLPRDLQTEIWRTYRHAELAGRQAVKQFQKSYEELTPAEKTSVDQSVMQATAPAKFDEGNAASLAYEFERMLVSDKVFAGRVSEAAAADPVFGGRLIAWLKDLISRLRNAIAKAPQEIRVTIGEHEARLVAAVRKIEAALDKAAGTEAQQLAAKNNSRIDLTQDNRASLKEGSTETPVRTDFKPVLGKTGTAYTDSNDAVEYQWAVVDVNSLNISNADNGAINPEYPQELQPRDRTSAGSEAQVADIAKNMNLGRLSASNGVGDGAPIIGSDAVGESGNGRLMGMRRAWNGNTTAARTYRSQLISTAAAYGLNAEQVEAVANPVLVRLRTTELNRVAFVLSANVSTIAPKREIEQAKIDAKQIVPDLFESFVPSEDGEIFTAANADFIRGFIASIIPPAERPAVIDASGNLTQTGLRRIRNALFVHAYGSSPETLNALARLTEAIDSKGAHIGSALVAMAPRFAELNARQEAGALYPLSITQDLAWTVQKLQDLRNRGEKVQDFLDQDRIPGIGDDPTPLQRQLLQYFDANGNKPRQLIETLSRYASAMDHAGDPRQASLFGDTRPTREELFALSSSAVGATKPVLASAQISPQDTPRRRDHNWTTSRGAVLDALASVEKASIHRRASAAPDIASATALVGGELRNAGFYGGGKSWEGTAKGLRVRLGAQDVTVPWKTVATIARTTHLDGSPIAGQFFNLDDRTSKLPADPESKTIRNAPALKPDTALKAYRKLKALEAQKGTLDGFQSQTLRRAEESLGQLFLFDTDTTPGAPFRLEQETVNQKPLVAPPEQLRLFSGAARPADPRLATTFGADWTHGWDAQGFPNPPKVLPSDSPLLEPSLKKTSFSLPDGHILVSSGILPAGKTLPRKTLHAAIVKYFMRGAVPVQPGKTPMFMTLGGGGGAGKSSILETLKEKGTISTAGAVEINADDIKTLIPEYNEIRRTGDSRAAATVHEESSHITKMLMARAMGGEGRPQHHIVYDATLGHIPSTLEKIQDWKKQGYQIHLIGVTVEPQEAIIRAFLRAKDSGRWVPLSALQEAHQGFNAGLKLYLEQVDNANVYDNTPPQPHEIAQKTGLSSPVSIVNSEYWSIIDRRHENQSSAPSDPSGSSQVEGESEGSGQPPLRETRPQTGSGASPRQTGPQDPSLNAARVRPDADTMDLFSFNQGMQLGDLLTPAQKDAKIKHAETLDLFGASPNARPRPTPQRPAYPARSPQRAKADQPAGDLGELFAAPGLAGTAGGRGPALGDVNSPGQPGGERAGADSPAGGGTTGGPQSDTSAAGMASEGADGDLSGVPGERENTPAEQPRPDVGSPDRNFAAPADADSLAPHGDRAKILANIEAIRLLKQLEGEHRNPTPEEKTKLAAYTGWGAFKEAFNSKYEEDIAKYWDGKAPAQKQYMPDWLQSWEKNHRPLHKLLKENMTADEFSSASASTLNAHYTAAPIIRSMWKMVQRMGFTGGRTLEPSAGNGHFLGLQPASLADRTQWQTVELDDLSARLLSKLYPEANVNESQGGNPTRTVTGLGFERARIPNGSLDLIISNVPFHESGPKKKGFPTLNLHNYFFAHALDKVKPGGIVAFITSESTMQNNIRQRDFIASKGDLVAAIRLPNNAFKENAGTEVTTDIIFIRKPDGTPFKGQPWRNLTEVGRQTITLTQGKDQTVDEFRREAERTGTLVGKEYFKNGKKAQDVSAPVMVNEYFVNHPQNALGTHTLASTMYRAGGYALVAPDSMDVSAALDALVPSMPENVMGQQQAAGGRDVVLADKSDKPFSFKEQDGKIYEVQPDGSMLEAEWSTNPEMVRTWRSWKRVSAAVEALVRAENSPEPSDLATLRRDLNIAYDTHIATHKPVSRRFSNKHRHIYSDPAYPLTAALENEKITVDRQTGKKTYSYAKAEIFKKRIGRPIVVPTKAANIDEALQMALAWKGRIDPEYGASLLGISPAAFTAQALTRPDIFENPASSLLEHTEEYLSGNVRHKLEAATEAARDNPKYLRNVEALRAAQPERREITRISPVLGARWIPAQVYQAFIKDVLGGSDTVEYIPAGNSWIISGTGLYRTEDHGTEDKGPASLFKHALDMTEPMVYRGSGENRVFDATATAAAKTALDKMRRAFVEFAKTSESPVTVESETEGTPATTIPVWEAVENAFNETQNSYVTPKHSGAYLQFPGLNTDYVYTKAHRRSVIARFLSTRRGMMAHGVGSGKTFNQIILAQEMRRLGLAKKPMIVVQNATLGQFAKSYLKAYPGAKVLVPTKSDFQALNRQRLVAKIATGDWDAIILPHSQFDLISNKEEAVKAYMDGEIQTLSDLVSGEKDKAKVKDLEGMLKRLKDRRQGMLDDLKERQDVAVMWEDLGVDALIMDEAHNYKSLPIVTRMGRVKGVPASSDSQRAINFMLKCRNVQSRTGGKNIFLATGTPIKNSMAEAYIMMQFMAPDVLADFNIHNFDDFATTYGQTITEAEQSWGGVPKMVTRFAKFQNGASLVTMIRTMFDVAFGNEQMGLDVPKIKGGEPELLIVPATPAIDRFNAWTRSVDAAWQNADPSEKEEFTAVPIQTMQAGIAAALDPRLISPNLEDHPESKVNVALRRVVSLYKSGTPRRETQIIFSDLRNQFKMDYLLPFTGHPFPEGSEGSFDLYKDIKAKLVAAGIPENEVYLMESGLSDVKKAAVFEKVDNGEIRIIVGSTELLGVGVNIQTRLGAVHHLMPPRDFTPAMYEQRNGRIIRQGNLHSSTVEGQPAWNEPVDVINFGTDGSMDSAIYGTMARKNRFITQLLMGENMGDTFDDPTDPVAVNMAEMAARTLGDPDFIRQIELEREIKDLRLQSDAFTNELAGKRSRLSRAEGSVARLPALIADEQRAAAKLKDVFTRTAPRPEGVKEETDISDKPVYQFGDRTIDTAAKENNGITTPLDLWLLDLSKTMERRGQTKTTGILQVNGHPFTIEVHSTLPGQTTPGSILYEGGKTANFSGSSSLIQQLRRASDWAQQNVDSLRDDLRSAESTVQRLRAKLAESPSAFPEADKLSALELEAQQVKARIEAKAAPPPTASTTPGTDQPNLSLPEMKPVDPALLTPEVQDVIDNADIIGHKVFIQETLDRQLYQRVNKALESAGGVWNKKHKAHLFRSNPSEVLGRNAPLNSARISPSGYVDPSGVSGYPVSYEAAPPDPFTGAPSLITSSRVLREQGQTIGHEHARRLRAGLREGREKSRFGPPLADSRNRAFSVVRHIPVLDRRQFARLERLPVLGEGSEARVHADKKRGVVYKILQGGGGNPTAGIWPQLFYTADGRLDFEFAPAERPRHLGTRLAVQTLIGGTPTELVGIGPDGHIILKQPLSPDAELKTAGTQEDPADPDTGRRLATAAGRAAAGLLQVPRGMMSDPASPPVFVGWVEGRPWLFMDMHPDNFVGDNQNEARLNDPVIVNLTADIIAKVPGLAQVVKAAQDKAAQLGDRSARLFAAPVSPAVPQTPQTSEVSPLARLGWNHLDRALSGKVAAHTRWVREGVAETVARWMNTPSAQPFAQAFRSIKKELFPDSVLPREVLAAKREMEIKTSMGSQRAMDLVRALSGNPKFSDIAFPPQFAQNPKFRRDLYEAMAGEKPLSSLPPELQTLATRLRALLVQIGQEAVKQGRMSLDTFDNLRGSYMPHYYEEDVKREKSLVQKFRLGVRDILAQRTTAWHITDTSQKDAQGEARLVSHSGNQWRFRNAEHMNAFYADFINQQVLQELRSRHGKKFRALTAADLNTPSKLDAEVRGRMQELKRQLSARYKRNRPLTIGEQEKAGLIMDPVYAIARYAAQMAHDNSTAEFFNDIAANPAHVSDIATPQFTEIPDNPRFGRLAGKWVKDEIAQQVLEMAAAPGVALQIYDTLMGWWKTGKTVLNPGTHVRNVLGNIFFAQLAGNSLHNPANLTYYRQALKAMREGGAVLTEAYDSGVLGADFVSAELRQTLRQLLPDPQTIEDDGRASGILMGMGKAIGKVLPVWARNPLSKGYSKVAALYQAEDEVFKLAAFLKAKAMLGDSTAAAEHVRKWFPYFDSGSSGTLKLIGRTAMPFLGFYRESIRIFGHALKERPLALATGLAIPSLITALSAMLLGLDDDDLEDVKKDMRGKAGKLLGPTPLEGMPLFSMLLPARSSEGTLQQFDISAIHPFVDFLGNRVEGGTEEDWWQKTLRSLFAAGPLGSLAYSQMTGKDTFGDRTFVENNMTGPEKLAARLDNAAKTLLPPLAPFGSGFTSLMHAGERSTNKTFETRNTAQTAARTLGGLDVRNATPDLYRLADDWRKKNGYDVQEGMDYGGSTPVSRARKALFTVLAQDAPSPTAVTSILAKLKQFGHPITNQRDIDRLLTFKDPLKLIGGNKARGITAASAQAAFRASLSGEARAALDRAQHEYQQIQRKAPALLLR